MMSPTIQQKSFLFRSATWLLVVAAVVMAAWLFYELAMIWTTLSERTSIARLIGLVVSNCILAVILVVIGLLFLWVRFAQSLPDLKGWHLQWPASEFCSADGKDGYSFDDYLQQENRVFDELNELIQQEWVDSQPLAYNRYELESVCNPETVVDRNWNRSAVLDADDPVGGVLLIHGLSDSPYSLRALGNRLHREGYTVIWLRVPGHGTCPGALANVTWEDWTEAVRVAAAGLRDRLPPDCPMFLAGYSNGGALSIHYAISAIEDESLPQVKGVLLFSPMIGINPLAKITRLYHMVGLVSRNQKSQWSNVSAEIDPFKYSSWPMNANVQAWTVTQIVERKLAKLEKLDRMKEMPPVLAMQSIVDSTVVVPKLITVLFNRLTTDESELFLFDINRLDWLGNLFNLSFENQVFPKLERKDLPFRLTLMRNEAVNSLRAKVETRDGEAWIEQAIDLSWPKQFVSLSHIAIPIPPDDTIYGSASATNNSGLPLGSLSMRAEPSALMIPNSAFIRCRYNPFYNFMEDRVIAWLANERSPGKPARAS
jgi:alpha-beta hydrolase superfamily lysophospholipase